jgi:hypothetical protein
LLEEGGKASSQEISLCFENYRQVKEQYYKICQQEMAKFPAKEAARLEALIKHKSKLGTIEKDSL